MILSTKSIKKYLIQYYDTSINKWINVDCPYNGSYNFVTRTLEGADRKPLSSDIEDAMKSVSNFADSMFRVVERTIIILDETNKLKIR